MKVIQIEFVNAITLPGTEVLGASSITAAKYPRARVRINGNFVFIEDSGKVGVTPITNVKSAVIEEDADVQGPRKSK